MKAYRIFKKAISIALYGLVLYLSVLIIGSCVPVNANYSTADSKSVTIYLETNGIHTDIIIPCAHLSDLTPLFIPPNYETRTSTWMAFGWGDQGFYLETPHWADLKFKTALKAMLHLDDSVMHVRKLNEVRESKSCVKLTITTAQYKALVDYISSSFARKKEGLVKMDARGYSQYDVFYKAEGRYSLFKTCNTWVNSGLKKAGIRTCLYTIFDKPLFWSVT